MRLLPLNKPMSSAIYTEHLSKRYGERLAVDDLNLDVGMGDVFGFLGPNGAGKTTTIAMLLGLVRPSSGRAVLLGHDIQHALEQALAGVGAMIEAPAFYPYLSARDNLRVLARSGGVAETQVDRVLAQVELEGRARDRYRTFSQGMRQRLAIAAALLHDPRLVILDEPTNGLDPAGQRDIRALIQSLASAGRTIFISSHQLHDIEQICRRVAILRAGRVVAEGAVADLLRRGAGVFVRPTGDAAQAAALLGALAAPGAVTPLDGGLLVEIDAGRAAEITAMLADHGIGVAEVREHKRHLEDLFLELTEGHQP
jgi:ABC-2 type transport system ATP-binding protein